MIVGDAESAPLQVASRRDRIGPYVIEPLTASEHACVFLLRSVDVLDHALEEELVFDTNHPDCPELKIGLTCRLSQPPSRVGEDARHNISPRQ
jgi:hypothetical protein